MAHVMVDLETLSTVENAALLSIGAVKFNFDEPMVDQFYVTVDPASCQHFGLHVDAGTVMWWFGEDRSEARKDVLEGAVDIASALDGFAAWFGPKSLPVWGNGATFDNVILSNAFKAIGMERPWSYKDDRCYRTINALGKANLDAAAIEAAVADEAETHHNALDDALYQTRRLRHIVTALGLKL